MWGRALDHAANNKLSKFPGTTPLGTHLRINTPSRYGGRLGSAKMQGCQQYSSGLKVADSQLNPSQRIYILGIGNIGKLFSHALATKPQPPPISLLLHRETLLDAWAEAGRAVEIVTDGVSNRDGMFDVELISKVDETTTRLPDSIIENLIVSTKTTNTATALSSIRHRLGPGSTILFAQNGMGTVEEVSKVVFPQPETRPRYLACVTSHGIFSQGPFSSVHAGKGTIAIGDVQEDEKEPAYITQQMIQSPVLTAREVSSSELKLLQLEKLVINAMMNPLTAIFDRRNGELFSSPAISRLMSLLLSEVSDVIRALPELQQDPSIQDRFSMKVLHGIVLNVAKITAKNTSSMLQDVRAGRPTEIDYINGYIAQRGAELGIDCNNNERLSDMVRQTRVIAESEIGQYFPDYI